MPIFGRRVVHKPKHMRSVEEELDTDISHHGIKGMKWGVRNYQDKNGHYTSEGKLRRQVLAESNTVKKSLTTKARPFVSEPIDISKVQARGSLSRAEADECAQLATDIFKTAQKHEPKITSDVIDAVSKSNAKMYGLDYRMKQPTSLAAKIGSDAKSDGVSFKQASNDIHDAIRYTAVSDPSNFSHTYNSVKKQLEANGYSEVQCKNYFQRFSDGKVSHKAVQSVYSTPDGASFELQFQTPESQAVKELKIPLYEEARKTSTSADRRQQLSTQMRMLGDNIKDPDGVFDILEHDEIYSDSVFGTRVYLAHHGIKGQQWGVRNGPPYPLKQPRTDISNKTYAEINKLYKSMPLADRRMIDPDISDELQNYFKDSKYYHDNTAFNAVSDHGFVIAEKIPADKNIDGTHGVEIGIGVTEKGRGVGTGLTKDLVDWFDGQDEYDVMWWPVDESNKGSIRIAEKNGFVKDPLGSNYIYGKNEALYKLGVKSPPNSTELKDYHGPAYFVSENKNLKSLEPRVPDNFFTKNGYEDSETKRVCLAPSVDKCLAGLSQNLDNKTLSVYEPVDISKHRVYKPNTKAVPDSKITDEMWVCDTVPLRKVKTIRITGNRGEDGTNFEYGDHTATLYDDWVYDDV